MRDASLAPDRLGHRGVAPDERERLDRRAENRSTGSASSSGSVLPPTRTAAASGRSRRPLAGEARRALGVVAEPVDRDVGALREERLEVGRGAPEDAARALAAAEQLAGASRGRSPSTRCGGLTFSVFARRPCTNATCVSCERPSTGMPPLVRFASSSTGIRSGSIVGRVPRPLHVGHQPRGLLWLKNLGSGSGTVTPSRGQVRPVESARPEPSLRTTTTLPLPSASASSSAARSASRVAGLDAHARDDLLEVVLVPARDLRHRRRREQAAVHAHLARARASPRPRTPRGGSPCVRGSTGAASADLLAAVLLEDAVEERLGRPRLERARADGAVRHAGLREEEAEVVRDLGLGRDGRARRAARRALGDRDRRRDAGDAVDVGAGQLSDELPRVGRERLDVATLALGEDDVERERGLPRARRPGHDDERVARDRARPRPSGCARARPSIATSRRGASPAAAFGDLCGEPRAGSASRSGSPRASSAARRCRAVWPSPRATASGVPSATSAPARRARLGAEIDHPVGRRDDVEVVLDGENGVPAIDEARERLREAPRRRRGGARWSARRARRRAASPRSRSASASAIRRRCASPPESVESGCPRRR